MHYNDILKISIIEIDGEKAIDILENGYNIIKESIYNDELAKKILNLLKENSNTL